MKNIEEYKFKYKYLNDFFRLNSILFYKRNTKKKSKIICKEIEIDNNKINCIIFDNKINSKRKYLFLKELALELVDDFKIPDYLYTDIRLDIKEEVFLSKDLNIKVKKLNKETKLSYVVYNYFKTKDLIERQGYDKFFNQYKVALENETVDSMLKHVSGGVDGIEDYFYIVTIKNIIHLYSKEVDNKIDYQNPSFSNSMLFKYFNNYYEKFVIVDYDKNIIKKFLSKYYITEYQSEDRVSTFIDNFLYLYKLIVGIKFTYENKYRLNIKRCGLYNSRVAGKIKYKNFYKYFDLTINNNKNYQDLIFIFEILEPSEYKSDKKKIVNYISVFELLLVKGDKNISYQVQNKCLRLVNNKYTSEELRLIYDYRSKIIHGEYELAILKLNKLKMLKEYDFSNYSETKNYRNINQMVENKISLRLNVILKIIMKYFVFKNEYLKQLKSEY